jgi:4-hydroxybenzoyl-CoA reductase subunit beta
MGTLGGNIALDTRCFWYNKDRAWRETLGGCLKVDGKVCHVTGSTSKCVAARAGDTVGPLLLYGAVLEVHTTDGHIIEVPIGEAFTSSGLFPEHLNLPCGSFIRNVRIPRAPANLRTHFCKIAPRLAIDFATIALTIGATIEREVCETIRIVITSVRPDPRVLTITIGKPITEDIADEIAMRVERAVKPLTNVWGDPSFQSWRATRAGIETKRALMAFA